MAMSNDSIKRLDALRSYYRSTESTTNDSLEREIRSVKHELKILNDENAISNEKITNAKNSPYLPDKDFFYKDIILNSAEESEWKEVKSYESIHNRTAQYNLKKLNII